MLKCSTVGDVVVRNRSLLTIRLMYVLLGPSMDGSMDEYCVSMFEAALTQLAAPEEVKEVKEEVKEEERQLVLLSCRPRLQPSVFFYGN